MSSYGLFGAAVIGNRQLCQEYEPRTARGSNFELFRTQSALGRDDRFANWKTLTWDQGTELAQHRQITLATTIAIYFCDPHSPWQRGTNENANGLLRQYFPKGTDLSIHSPERLLEVATELNNRPRKTLGGITLAQAMQRLLSEPEKPIVATTG